MGQRLKIAFHTLGCKLNFSETSDIIRDFAKNDEFRQVASADVADIYVINSCSVTKNAEKKCYELIRRFKRQNPGSKIAVIGCFSQLKPGDLSATEKVDIILGNHEKFKLYDYILKYDTKNSDQTIQTGSKLTQFIPTCSGEDRTRTFLKIQDGCDYACSYCIVPRARGRSRSDTIAGTLEKVKKLAENEVKEVVLTGVNIGDFGKNQNETFLDLLKELDKLENIKRIRLSSIEPDLLDDEIIKLVAGSGRIMPHFHIPLQSGSDKVLKAMGRNYDTSLFASKVEKIKELMPFACVAVDVIAGFPLETHEDFYDSYRFIESLPVSYLHVFTYSERPNTSAAKLTPVYKSSEKSYRSDQLKELSKNKLQSFYEKNKGEKADVLFEQKSAGGFLYGFTPNYVRVKTPCMEELQNNIKKVQLTDFGIDMVFECKKLEKII